MKLVESGLGWLRTQLTFRPDFVIGDDDLSGGFGGAAWFEAVPSAAIAKPLLSPSV